jgi:hypothetical protein
MRARHSGAITRRGSTLVTVTILLGTMTVLALVFLRVGQRMGQEQDANLDSTRASLLAEAGISEAVEAIRAGKSGNLGSAEAPAYLGGGVIWVEATDLGGGRTQLDSMAMKESGRAALRVVVEAGVAVEDEDGDGGDGNGFMGMLYAREGIQLAQGVMIDSYDSKLGTYASQAVNTHNGITYAGSNGGASSSGNLQVDSLVNVFGDVYAGEGYSPKVATDAYVSGEVGTLSEPIELTQIPVPLVLPGLPYAVANGATKTINPGTYHFPAVTQGKLSKLRIVGPATLVFDSYKTGVSATLELDCTNGPISIYCTGVWSVDQNYKVGPAPGTPVDAAFLVSSTGTVRFNQGSQIYVGFYAPNATIQVDQGAEVWGGLVANQIKISQNTHFHFDENLRDFDLPWEVPDPDATGGVEDPEIVSWSKIEFPVSAYLSDRRDPLEFLQVQKSELPTPAEATQDK